MKQRMITVAYGIALLLIILLFYKTFVLNIAVAAVTVISVYEIFFATKSTDNAAFMLICFIFAAAVPFANYLSVQNPYFLIYFLYIAAVFVLLILRHKTLKAEKTALCMIMTLLVTSSMACIIYLRDRYLNSMQFKDIALFYIALVFIGAWMADAGGYIFGSIFGKHKLSPEISPKKTIEGAIGGLVLDIFAFAGALAGYGAYLSYFGTNARLNYASILILSVLCAFASIVGDLSASLIKRENNVKDYGKILPGHGGMLDRFDSVLFVAPLVLLWVNLFPVIAI
jgi:phosphatidate cytidylyltransferase